MKNNTLKSRKILRSYLVYKYDEHNIINTSITEKHRVKILNGFINNILDNFHPSESIALAINLGVLIDNYLEEKLSFDDIGIIFTNHFFNDKIVKVYEMVSNDAAKKIFSLSIELFNEDKKMFYLFANKRFFIDGLDKHITKSLSSDKIKALINIGSKSVSEDINF